MFQSIFCILFISSGALAHQRVNHKAVWGNPGQDPLSDMNSDGGTIPHVKDWLCHAQKKPDYPAEFVTIEPGKPITLAIGNDKDATPEATDRHGGNSGCAIAIDYTGKGTNPDDFIVISIAANCPNKALGNDNVEFKMPDNLPPCEDCACQWHWIPSLEDAAEQQYSNCFSCKVAGSNPGKSIQGKVPYYYAMNDTKDHNSNKKPEYNSNPDYPDGPQKITIASVGGYTPTNSSRPDASSTSTATAEEAPATTTSPDSNAVTTGSSNAEEHAASPCSASSEPNAPAETGSAEYESSKSSNSEAPSPTSSKSEVAEGGFYQTKESTSVYKPKPTHSSSKKHGKAAPNSSGKGKKSKNGKGKKGKGKKGKKGKGKKGKKGKGKNGKKGHKKHHLGKKGSAKKEPAYFE